MPELATGIAAFAACVGIVLLPGVLLTTLAPIIASHPGISASVIKAVAESIIKGKNPAKSAKDFGVDFAVAAAIEQAIKSAKKYI